MQMFVTSDIFLSPKRIQSQICNSKRGAFSLKSEKARKKIEIEVRMQEITAFEPL